MCDLAGHTISFVQVPHSSSDKQSFSNTKSWIGEALKINGSSHNGTFGSVFCVSNQLCCFYRGSFVAALEKQGMVNSAICGNDECSWHQ